MNDQSAIDFEQLGIGEALHRYRLVVPANQRDYAWGTEQVKTLFEELVDGLRQKSLGLGFPSALFCATVVDAYRNIIHGFRFPSQAA